MEDAGTKCLYNALFKIISADGKPNTKKQSDIEPTYAPKIKNVKIDWNWPASKIYDYVRALTFYNGAYTYINGIEVRILATSISCMSMWPKEISFYKGRLIIGAGNHMGVAILTVKPAGKKEMSAADFINGLKNKTDKIEVTD